MSLANKLGNIYTDLNTALNDANSALVEKGGSEVADISSIGDEIRELDGGLSTVIKNWNSIDDVIIILPRVDSIRDYAFYSFYNLDEVTIPDSVTTIGLESFYDCGNLKKVTINGSVLTSIGNRAFYNCGFTNITIPSSVTNIGNSAFSTCTKLTDIYLNPTTPPTAGTFIFTSSYIPTIHVPIGSGDAYKSATNWSTFADNIVEDIVVE